jgi:integrase
MARPLKPWYHKKKQAWVIEPAGKLHVLLAGPNDPATEQLALQEFTLYQARRIEQARANPPVDAGDPTVASVIEAFLAHDERHRSARTYYERKRYLQLFAEKHGRKLIRECKAFHLTSWMDEHPQWANPSTHSYVVRCVKRPFHWAVGEDLIAKNPFRYVKHASGAPRRPISQEEYTRLIETASQRPRWSRFVDVLRFMRLTGCRPGEVRILRWQDLDLERGVIVLRKHKTSRTRKDRAPRVIHLVPEVIELLGTVRARGDHQELVFVRRGRKQWSRNGLQQNVRRLRRQIGLAEDVVLYGIRHEFGTRGIVQGVDLKTRAELMGHTTTRMTENYVHLNDQDQHLADAMRRLNDSHPGV